MTRDHTGGPGTPVGRPFFSATVTRWARRHAAYAMHLERYTLPALAPRNRDHPAPRDYNGNDYQRCRDVTRGSRQYLGVLERLAVEAAHPRTTKRSTIRIVNPWVPDMIRYWQCADRRCGSNAVYGEATGDVRCRVCGTPANRIVRRNPVLASDQESDDNRTPRTANDEAAEPRTDLRATGGAAGTQPRP